MIAQIEIHKNSGVTMFRGVKNDGVAVVNPIQFCRDWFEELRPQDCTLGAVLEMGTY